LACFIFAKVNLRLNKSSAVAEVGHHLAIIDMGGKLGAVPSFLWEMGPHLTQSRLGWPISVPSGILIHPAIWPQWTWAENWGLCPYWGEAGSPSNTVARAEAYLHAKFHLDPSSRLATIHQRHRQDNGPIA